MQNQTPPLIISFGLADPVGAFGTYADFAVYAAHGCQGLAVSTAVLVADTARIEDQQEIEADWLVDQARVLLEDMHIDAIKVGALISIDQASAIAEICSDYPDVPMILDPFASALPDSGLGDDDLLMAIRQILVPQATVLQLSQVELARMAETWRDGGEDMQAQDVAELTGMGCEFVLVNCTAIQGKGVDASLCNTLYDGEGVVATFNWPHLAGPFVGAGSTTSAALAALLAKGQEPEEAILNAQQYTAGALAHAQRFGMGKLVPNKFFRLSMTAP